MEVTPAELMMGRTVRSKTIGSARREVDLARAKQKRIQDQVRIREKLGRGRPNGETFKAGDRVRVQNPKTLKWDTKGIIMRGLTHEGGEKPVSYLVANMHGAEFLRNGKFLRLRNGEIDMETQPPENVESEESQEEQGQAVPRRSVRFRNHGVGGLEPGAARGHKNRRRNSERG